MKYKVTGTDLTSVADAIRTKGGTSSELSFPDGFVSAIQNIPTGGGSTLITKSVTANGTYNAQDDNANGYSSVSVAVPMPPFVTGTFTPQDSEKNAVKTISIPYSGNGYPITCMVYPTAGAYKSGTDIYNLAQKKAIVTVWFVKCDMSTAPDYDANTNENKVYAISTYKNSDSDATQYTASNTATESRVFTGFDPAGSSANGVIRFSNASTMRVFIADTNVYGFVAGVEYTYEIVYSS